MYCAGCLETAGDRWFRESFGDLLKPELPKPKRQRRPRLKTLLDQGKEAGATSVTRDGVTYGVPQATEASPAAEPNLFEREAERLRQSKRGAE